MLHNVLFMEIHFKVITLQLYILIYKFYKLLLRRWIWMSHCRILLRISILKSIFCKNYFSMGKNRVYLDLNWLKKWSFGQYLFEIWVFLQVQWNYRDKLLRKCLWNRYNKCITIIDTHYCWGYLICAISY